jgi:hypothetical protein
MSKKKKVKNLYETDLTSDKINSYKVGKIPEDDLHWMHSKLTKCWMYSYPHMGWLFVFTVYDDDVHLMDNNGTQFRYHILSKYNNGIKFENCPDWIQEEFEYQLNILVEKGILIPPENK